MEHTRPFLESAKAMSIDNSASSSVEEPLVPEPPIPDSQVATPPASPSDDVGGRRVLIVESEVVAADELARLMQEMGHIVQLAADAKTALFELHEFNPHLVLLGTYLADMPGYELSSILHGAPQYSYRFRHVGLLFVADRSKILKHRFIGAPAVPMSQYIFKPLDASEVREKVTRTLRQGVM
jgi:PleD family two-component response regulator